MCVVLTTPRLTDHYSIMWLQTSAILISCDTTRRNRTISPISAGLVHVGCGVLEPYLGASLLARYRYHTA
jgi:hypothetical protein